MRVWWCMYACLHVFVSLCVYGGNKMCVCLLCTWVTVCALYVHLCMCTSVCKKICLICACARVCMYVCVCVCVCYYDL